MISCNAEVDAASEADRLPRRVVRVAAYRQVNEERSPRWSKRAAILMRC